MQPQQPYYQPAQQTPGSGQYDFIFQDQQPKRRLSTGGTKSLIIISLIFAAVVGIIWFIISLASGTGKEVTEPYVTLVNKQSQIINVMAPGPNLNAFTSQDILGVATNVKLTLTTDRRTNIDILNKNGNKTKEDDLKAVTSATAQKALDSARTSGTFDSTYLAVTKSQLESYIVQLQQTYNKTGAKYKPTIKAEFDNATLLLEQVKNYQ